MLVFGLGLVLFRRAQNMILGKIAARAYGASHV